MPHNQFLINLVSPDRTRKYLPSIFSHRPRTFVDRSVRQPRACTNHVLGKYLILVIRTNTSPSGDISSYMKGLRTRMNDILKTVELEPRAKFRQAKYIRIQPDSQKAAISNRATSGLVMLGNVVLVRFKIIIIANSQPHHYFKQRLSKARVLSFTHLTCPCQLVSFCFHVFQFFQGLFPFYLQVLPIERIFY